MITKRVRLIQFINKCESEIDVLDDVERSWYEEALAELNNMN